MAGNVTIDQLPDVSTLTGAEFAALVQGGVTSRATVTALAAFFSAAAAVAEKQLQSITATVGSSELTISLLATTLSFRSTTLTSGTPSNVTAASPLSLVVPSGATLGTVSGSPARLAVLAINNAGTMELAVVNTSGSVDLNETSLISTTAISNAADSASVVYSATARTNVAFRVVGFIDISEVTAGTWDTAPTLVQGIGGRALISAGDGRQWQDVSGSRSSGTAYQNTTGRDIQVALTSYVVSGGCASSIQVSTDNSTFVTAAVDADGGYAGNYAFATAIIPPGHFYKYSWSGGLYLLTELR